MEMAAQRAGPVSLRLLASNTSLFTYQRHSPECLFWFQQPLPMACQCILMPTCRESDGSVVGWVGDECFEFGCVHRMPALDEIDELSGLVQVGGADMDDHAGLFGPPDIELLRAPITAGRNVLVADMTSDRDSFRLNRCSLGVHALLIDSGPGVDTSWLGESSVPPTVATQTDSVTRCAYGTSSVTSAIQPAGSGSAARSTDGAGGIGVTIGVAFNDCAKATSWSRVIADPASSKTVISGVHHPAVSSPYTVHV